MFLLNRAVFMDSRRYDRVYEQPERREPKLVVAEPVPQEPAPITARPRQARAA